MNNTRVANATKTVAAARKQLAVMADGPTSAGVENLLNGLFEVAKLETVQRMEERAAHVVGWHLDNGHGLEFAKEQAIKSLQSEVLNGADDTWSGRGNDLKRVQFEAKLEWLRNELGR